MAFRPSMVNFWARQSEYFLKTCAVILHCCIEYSRRRTRIYRMTCGYSSCAHLSRISHPPRAARRAPAINSRSNSTCSIRTGGCARSLSPRSASPFPAVAMPSIARIGSRRSPLRAPCWPARRRAPVRAPRMARALLPWRQQRIRRSVVPGTVAMEATAPLQ
jgi:hypothetical protein